MSCGRLFQLALILGLTWVGNSVGWAQDAATLERARHQAATLRSQSAQLREQQQRLRAELSEVSATIESLKARTQGKVLRDPALESALRRSQELSTQLAALARQVSDGQAELQNQHRALLTLLSEALTQLRSDWEKAADRAQRRVLLARMKTLRMERDHIRALLPATAALPALAEPSATDDPEELLEQADALRDIEDKVRAQLKRIEGLLAQAREEHAFDRRMDEFLGDEALFDDSDRRLRLQRPSGGRIAAEAVALPRPDSHNPPAGAPAGAPAPNSDFSSNGSPSSPDLSGTMSAKTGQPQVLSSRAFELENPRNLEIEQKRLEALAVELNARAKQLEAKARSLR